MSAITRTIKASSRASVKVRDNYYTVEFCEERSVPDNATDEELMAERKNLWDTVNYECDVQIEDIVKTYTKSVE
jgi:hypothetical protein